MVKAITKEEFHQFSQNMSKPMVLEFGADW
ncbi:thioredoxin [Aquibacillus saliphilus]|nr:thioredoxin [Aquibacillus saliphilus]